MAREWGGSPQPGLETPPLTRYPDRLASDFRHRLLLVIAAVLFSTGGVAIKSATLTPWQVACFRSLAAAVVFLILLPGARRSWKWSTAAVSLAYAATLILFVLATRLTTAANAI